MNQIKPNFAGIFLRLSPLTIVSDSSALHLIWRPLLKIKMSLLLYFKSK